MKTFFFRRLFCFILLSCAMSYDVVVAGSPVANPKSVVTEGAVRFTILTPQLIRMEWSENSTFEDHPSLLVINRNLPVPEFSVKNSGDILTIQTKKLTLKYRKNSGKFSKNNLECEFSLNGKKIVWNPGMKDTANLKGTTRTLDGVEGAASLEPGLLSRDGWTLIDDSRRALFDNSDWPWVVQRPDTNHQDWYFFAYGHDYKQQLYDFTQVAGKIPIPPRFAFGLWWSRYWSYTDQEFKELVQEFRQHDVPLDVLVIDMDWHLTFNLRWGKQPKDQAGQPLGWTGYTWDKNVFPDPEGFLSWCKEQGLKAPLNLHPASGIQPHEEHYPEMAKAMGIDPSTKQYVPFDIVDKKFATNYLDLILRPLEKQGVDFWWLDWQQWGTTKIEGVTPTWWLNYVHFTDMERQGKARPLLFHRWGGLGNHRYQIGFSGDAISVWKSLAFQPYFTATAANVGFGYWSHDIGGHLPGVTTPELYTRWIQFGIFSPIVRTHTTKNPDAERRIWAYPPEYFKIMRDAILLRYQMIPYIYTAARKAYDTGISICRPMYYDYPEGEEAYAFKDQYMFGNDMLVAPVADSLSKETMLTAKEIWIPEGSWFEWSTGTMLEGPAIFERSFAIDELPLYIKAGSVIPMQTHMNNTEEKPVNPLILTIIPGKNGETKVYEDQGNSVAYQRGEYAWTTVRHTGVNNGSMKVTIDPVEGSFPGMVKERTYEIYLQGTLPPDNVECNGQSLVMNAGWNYDGNTQTTIITTPLFSVGQKVEITIHSKKSDITSGMRGTLSRLNRVMSLINNEWPKEWSPDSLVAAVQTGNRISLQPQHAADELAQLKKSLPAIISQIKRLEIGKRVIERSVNHLSAKLEVPSKNNKRKK